MVVGKVKGGGEVVVGGGDGGIVPESDLQRMAEDATGGKVGAKNEKMTTGGEPHIAEFGSSKRYGEQSGVAPPPYSSELGEPMGSGSEKARPPAM